VSRRSTRASLDSTTERWGLKSENRNPKPETTPKHQQRNDQSYAAAAGFEHRAIGNLNLFRVSTFGFRISQPWIVALAECAHSTQEKLIPLVALARILLRFKHPPNWERGNQHLRRGLLETI
jgi:hypothetical protein